MRMNSNKKIKKMVKKEYRKLCKKIVREKKEYRKLCKKIIREKKGLEKNKLSYLIGKTKEKIIELERKRDSIKKLFEAIKNN